MEQVLNAVAIVVTVVAVAGWALFHAVGELWLALEVHAPAREPRAGWRTELRLDPPTGVHSTTVEPSPTPAGETR